MYMYSMWVIPISKREIQCQGLTMLKTEYNFMSFYFKRRHLLVMQNEYILNNCMSCLPLVHVYCIVNTIAVSAIITYR